MAKQLDTICSCFGRSWVLKPAERVRIIGNYVVCPRHGAYRAYTLDYATAVQCHRQANGWSRWARRYVPECFKQM